MNSPDHMSLHSEKSERLAKTMHLYANNTLEIFAGEKISADQTKNNYASAKLVDYQEMISEYLPSAPLSSKVLQLNLDYLREEAKLKKHLPAGQRVCLALIPFTQNGLDLSDQEIADGAFLRNLILAENDQVEYGFGQPLNALYKFLPVEVRTQLTFVIPPYEVDDPFTVTTADRLRLIELYKKAFQAAQTIFHKFAQSSTLN
ncbi:hypothetical protein IT411_00715 [Candidatus Peregrinibacteria bacterium]|nr:hypothetical protein [Candidatus Peregrinibacteria bacterium]